MKNIMDNNKLIPSDVPENLQYLLKPHSHLEKINDPPMFSINIGDSQAGSVLPFKRKIEFVGDKTLRIEYIEYFDRKDFAVKLSEKIKNVVMEGI